MSGQEEGSMREDAPHAREGEASRSSSRWELQLGLGV